VTIRVLIVALPPVFWSLRSPNGHCRYTVSECTTACKANPKCGGFNLPNGHLKTADCVQEINTSHTQELYVFAMPPAPPGPPLNHCGAAMERACGAEVSRSRHSHHRVTVSLAPSHAHVTVCAMHALYRFFADMLESLAFVWSIVV
jgi:hypothetical protein